MWVWLGFVADDGVGFQCGWILQWGWFWVLMWFAMGLLDLGFVAMDLTGF